MAEVVKAYRNAGERPNLTFFRDRHGLEVDGIVELGMSCCALEVKSGETVTAHAFANLEKILALLGRAPEHTSTTGALVYAGNERWRQKGVTVLPWHEVGSHPWPGLPGA